MQQKTLTATPLTWIALISLGMFWGASFMAAKVALVLFGPVSVSAIRLLIAGIVLGGICIGMRLKFPGVSTPTDRRIWLHILGMAIFSNAVPFSLLNWGQLHVGSAFAGICISVVPLFVLPFAHFLVPGENLTLRRIAGFLVGFIGVLILVGPGSVFAEFQSGNSNVQTWARLACVASAACYAVGSMFTRLCPPTPTMVFSAGSLWVAILIMVPAALYYEGLPDLTMSAEMRLALVGLVFLGLVSTAWGNLLRVWIINSAGPTFMSQINYQVPLWAVFFGVVFMGEVLQGAFLWALAFILAGLLLSRKPRKKANA